MENRFRKKPSCSVYSLRIWQLRSVPIAGSRQRLNARCRPNCLRTNRSYCTRFQERDADESLRDFRDQLLFVHERNESCSNVHRLRRPSCDWSCDLTTRSNAVATLDSTRTNTTPTRRSFRFLNSHDHGRCGHHTDGCDQTFHFDFSLGRTEAVVLPSNAEKSQRVTFVSPHCLFESVVSP